MGRLFFLSVESSENDCRYEELGLINNTVKKGHKKKEERNKRENPLSKWMRATRDAGARTFRRFVETFPKAQRAKIAQIEILLVLPGMDMVRLCFLFETTIRAEDLTSRCSRTRPREPPPISARFAADTRRGECAGSEGN